MNQSSAADQTKTATTKPTQYVVKLKNNHPLTLLKITQTKPSSSSSFASSSSTLSTQSVSLSSASDTADDLSVKYRTILEELLRLRIDLVTKSISAAIKATIVADLAHTTSDDWLLIIFKALERIIDALDISQIYSNESYLAAISRLLSRLIETSKLLELVESRSETKNFTQFFTQKMSGVLTLVSMEAVYKSAQEIFESKRRSSFAQILELLATSLTEWPATQENALSTQKLSLWFDHVVPLEFDADDDIQKNAIDAVEKVMPLLMVSKHQSHPEWTKYRNTIINKYVKEIGVLFQKDNARWHRTWCHCVQILDIEIPRSATTLNAFLGIVEPALRSVIPMRRAEGYLCWRVLLGVLVRHNRLNSEKRLKLACTPLKSLQAKTVEIASNKFQAWWYVLCNVVDNSTGYNSMVFEPFLQFCFGPLAAEPNIRSEITDTTAQVKRFPDVSLMAIATFIRILGEPSDQTTEIFFKYALDQIDRTICTEKQFQNPLARLIINACGEATYMLTNMGDDSNNNVDCSALAKQLWRNLLTHLTPTNYYDHMNLMLENLKQLLVTSAETENVDRKEKTINLVKIVVAMLTQKARKFNATDPESRSLDIFVGLLEILTMLPIVHSNNLLTIIMVIPAAATIPYVQAYAHHLVVKFLAVDEHCKGGALNISSDQVVRIKFRTWQKWLAAMTSWWRANTAAVEKLKEKSLNAFIDSIVECLLWPVTALIDNRESQAFAKSLSELAQLISVVVGKKSLCQRSAKSIRRAIELPQHCAHINNIVAVLFDFMNYDYKGLVDAPVDVLDLCIALIKKERKISFQDLNPIALAIINHYKAISKVQRAIIETKLREVMASIEKTKTEMRVDPKMISVFHDLIERGTNEPQALKTPKNIKQVVANGTVPESSEMRKNNATADEFVVVDKVWSLKPSRLTDHQKEKLKERRCDIPALYNNLSQSQDSVSLKEWTPKVATTVTSTVATVATTEVATGSAAPKSGDSVNGKNQDENVATNNTAEHKSSSSGKESDASKGASSSEPIVPKKLKFSDDVVSEEEEKKKRIDRELSRIHIDAVVEAVPFAEGVARRTRSSRSLDERAPKRKLRNDPTQPPPPPLSTTKQSTKAIRAPAQPKTKKQTDNKVTASDNEATEEIVQSSQPPHSDASSAQKKRKIRTMSMHRDNASPVNVIPIEKPSPTIEVKAVAEVVVADTASAKEPEKELAVAVIDTKENETESAKEEMTTEESHPSSALDDDDASAVSPSNDAVDVSPARNDASEVVEDVVMDDLSLSPVAAPTVDNNSILGKSYMSPLEYNDTSLRLRDTANDSILTSPKIDHKKNEEFLNDTLNISPIVPGLGDVSINNPADPTVPCSVVIECAVMVTPRSSVDHTARKSGSIADATTPIDPTRNSSETNAPEVAQQAKVFRSSQCSTPIQSNQSPISSKFKPQIMGRGAQLLKMINSNKNNNQQQQQQKQCALPSMMLPGTNEMGTILVTTTASPAISKLQTAPISGASVSTPEPANETTNKPELLTFSRVLPSPYESPRFSILKRKASRDCEEDSISSPAHKRKRVSFNIPLFETVEFIAEDEMAPIATTSASATNIVREIDALSIRSPANAKYKMKQKKRIDCVQMNHAKNVQASESVMAASTSIGIVGNKLFQDTNEDEVSVEHIKEYLEMDVNMHREKQKKLGRESVNPLVGASSDEDMESRSNEREATSLKADAATSPMMPFTLSSFSDQELFQHLFDKFNISEIFNKYEECKQQTMDTQLARFFSRKLSAIMANDASVKVAVLDELAEKHSTAFLDHAVTENLCSTVCDRLMASSKDSFVEYVGEKLSSDGEVASTILSRFNVKSLQNRVLSTSTSEDNRHLLNDIVGQMHPQNGEDSETIVALLSKIFTKFNFTSEQFHEFTKLHILQSIRGTTDEAPH